MLSGGPRRVGLPYDHADEKQSFSRCVPKPELGNEFKVRPHGLLPPVVRLVTDGTGCGRTE
jgi:hypothetical protein